MDKVIMDILSNQKLVEVLYALEVVSDYDVETSSQLTASDMCLQIEKFLRQFYLSATQDETFTLE